MDKTILNIFHNFIPNKNKFCYDKDPPWFNNQIKTLIEKKNHLLRKDRLVENRVTLKKTGVEMINEIKSAKENFYNNLAKN